MTLEEAIGYVASDELIEVHCSSLLLNPANHVTFCFRLLMHSLLLCVMWSGYTKDDSVEEKMSRREQA